MLTKSFQLMLMAYWMTEPRYVQWAKTKRPYDRARAVVVHDRVITGTLLSGVTTLDQCRERVS